MCGIVWKKLMDMPDKGFPENPYLGEIIKNNGNFYSWGGIDWKEEDDIDFLPFRWNLHLIAKVK